MTSQWFTAQIDQNPGILDPLQSLMQNHVSPFHNILICTVPLAPADACPLSVEVSAMAAVTAAVPPVRSREDRRRRDSAPEILSTFQQRHLLLGLQTKKWQKKCQKYPKIASRSCLRPPEMGSVGNYWDVSASALIVHTAENQRWLTTVMVECLIYGVWSGILVLNFSLGWSACLCVQWTPQKGKPWKPRPNSIRYGA